MEISIEGIFLSGGNRLVTGTNFNTGKSTKPPTENLMPYNDAESEHEKEGFYTSCGQAFIRISPRRAN
ncbi:MAG: hypothetical protein JW705_01935 [Methanosarcinaceae archaeon]|nr:hypothetical protein [Methanosarcinaceae archaeon]